FGGNGKRMPGAEGVGPRGTQKGPPSIEAAAEPPSGATGVVPVLPSLSGLAAPTSAASGTLAAGACAEQPASSATATATAGSPLLRARGARRMAPSAPRLAGRTERDDGNIGGVSRRRDRLASPRIVRAASRGGSRFHGLERARAAS